jgi:DNA-directed RNA polymerase specialized sigma24 family protein
MQKGTIGAWLASLQDGDSQAAQQLWERYFARLAHLAQLRLGSLPRRAADEEDVALSVMNSFLQGARDDRFPQLADETDLWRILVTITARKVSAQRRKHLAARRNRGKVRGESVFADHSGSKSAAGLEAVTGHEPDPAVAAQVTEECRKLFERLDDNTLCDIARSKLDGCTNEEIAERIGKSVRTVERKLTLIRDCWSAD